VAFIHALEKTMARTLCRLALTAIMTFGAVGAGNADDFWSDYQAALSAFRAGEADNAKFYEQAHRKILDGIDGRWTLISVLNPAIGDDAILRKACGIVFFDASRTSDFSFQFTRRSGNPGSPTVEYRYTLVSANIFGVSADDGEVLRFFGLDKSDTGLTPKLSVLRLANGLVELYRQGSDVLVVKNILGGPDIYARCK
jgi:hypothetical protein